MRRGTLPALKVPPKGSLDVRADTGSELTGERFLTFRFFLRRATEWAPAGHEVAWQQLVLPSRSVRSTERIERVRPVAAKGRIVLEAGGTRAVVDGATGVLQELRAVGARNVLRLGPTLQLWRAATDNDGLRLLPERNLGVLGLWLELGLDRLEHRLESVRVVPGGVDVAETLSGRGKWDDVVHRQRYRMLDSGGLLVEHEVAVGPDLRDLPRVGVVS